jgi:hypothetical protein
VKFSTFYFFFFTIGLALTLSTEVKGQCIKNKAFTFNEMLTYDVHYHCGPVWMHAGEAYFKTQKKIVNNKPSYVLESYGNSLPSYDKLFKVRDLYQATIDSANFQPLRFERRTYEGGNWAHDVYQFDRRKKKIYTSTQNQDNDLKRDTLAYNSCVYDVLTAIYFARNVDFSNRQVGEKIYFNCLMSNEITPLYMRYQGREKITLPNGQTYQCIKISAKLLEGYIFRGGEDLIAWITEDKSHVAVQVEAKILIGSVKAVLRTAKI